jgi:hypothetical protein
MSKIGNTGAKNCKIGENYAKSKKFERLVQAYYFSTKTWF